MNARGKKASIFSDSLFPTSYHLTSSTPENRSKRHAFASRLAVKLLNLIWTLSRFCSQSKVSHLDTATGAKYTQRDGETPCGRCASQEGVERIYETSVRLSKESHREEIRAQLEKAKIIQTLKAQLQQNEGGISGLSSVPSFRHASEQGTAMNFGDTSNHYDLSLSTSEFIGLPDAVQDAQGSQGYLFGQSTGYAKALRQLGIVDRWTNVTSDQEFIEHLCTLYFRWEYPLFASVSKEHF